MKSKIVRYMAATMLCLAGGMPAGWARQLTSTASVNVTSDTAATAKNMAISEARRQIVRDVLGQYADTGQLDALIQSTEDADLTNLIASSGIDNEQLSATTYSANITMTLERDAARSWLDAAGVMNWLGDLSSTDMSVVVIAVPGGLADWIAVSGVARNMGVELNTRRIMPRQIVAEISAASRAGFTAAMRDAGWRYSDDDGVLRLWPASSQARM